MKCENILCALNINNECYYTTSLFMHKQVKRCKLRKAFNRILKAKYNIKDRPGVIGTQLIGEKFLEERKAHNAM